MQLSATGGVGLGVGDAVGVGTGAGEETGGADEPPPPPHPLKRAEAHIAIENARVAVRKLIAILSMPLLLRHRLEASTTLSGQLVLHIGRVILP